MLPSAEQRRVIKKLLTRAVEDYRAETHPFGEPKKTNKKTNNVRLLAVAG